MGSEDPDIEGPVGRGPIATFEDTSTRRRNLPWRFGPVKILRMTRTCVGRRRPPSSITKANAHDRARILNPDADRARRPNRPGAESPSGSPGDDERLYTRRPLRSIQRRSDNRIAARDVLLNFQTRRESPTRFDPATAPRHYGSQVGVRDYRRRAIRRRSRRAIPPAIGTVSWQRAGHPLDRVPSPGTSWPIRTSP